jgi:hypothetical protein
LAQKPLNLHRNIFSHSIISSFSSHQNTPISARDLTQKLAAASQTFAQEKQTLVKKQLKGFGILDAPN